MIDAMKFWIAKGLVELGTSVLLLLVGGAIYAAVWFHMNREMKR